MRKSTGAGARPARHGSWLLVAKALLVVAIAGAAWPGGATGAARVLQEGMWGDDVRQVQETLRELGFRTVNPNGYYGPETTQAVKALQRAMGLPADGVIGSATARVVDALGTPYRYRVEQGDTLWNVARRFGTTMEALMDANGMEDTTLHPGQTITIPTVRRLFVPVAVQLRDLAARLGVPGEAMARLNGLRLTDTLQAGSLIWTPLPQL
ncbi:MAG: LysM peptidoglycan-binding domain-containing protein [Limnochordaceae bacterium]|nr:LysM peptidoglycan-binding domain-containing protein [Limnochordaceae bacterium]